MEWDERTGPTWPLALLAALAALLVYANALPQGFVYDDFPLVVWNERVHSLGRLADCFTSGYWSDGNTGLYRPLALASLSLNRALLGPEPWGFKLVNLLLHAGASATLVVLARDLGARRATAFAAGLLFALHPVHTEAVAWVSGRAELLCALLCLLTLVCYVRAGRASPPRRGRLRLATAALFAGALLSKEHALTLLVAAPVLDHLAHRGRGERPRRWVDVGLLLGVALAVFAARLVALGGAWRPQMVVPLDNPLVLEVRSLLGNTYGLPRVQGTIAALGLIPEHLRLLAWPAHLSADYSYDQLGLSAPGAVRPLLGLTVILGSALGLLALYRRGRLAACGLLLLAATLSTSSNLIVRIGTPLAERLLYLPSAGFVLVIAATWGRCWSRGGLARRLATAALVACLVLMGARTWTRTPAWSNRLSLWTETVRTSPRSAKAHLKLGGLLLELADARRSAGHADELRLVAAAAEHLSRSLAIYPEGAQTNEQLALCLTRLDRPAQALHHFRIAARLRRGAIPAHVRGPWSQALRAALQQLPAGETQRRRTLEAELEQVRRG